MTVNGMTSQQRFLLAQRLHKRAKDPNLSVAERDLAFRHARNLVRINMAVAVREVSAASAPDATATPKATVPPKPTFDRKV
ncbi:MAG: hypothetical protein K2Y71_00780 [Xanthobacteraceae bacterium]|nr:hypothetical protein [Xanthobacteraceae bacterium]